MIEGRTVTSCQAHAAGIPVRFEPIRIKQTSLAHLLPKVSGVNDRQAVHRLAATMKEKGLTHYQISHVPESQGYEQVTTRTVGKHLRGECACFPSALG